MPGEVLEEMPRKLPGEMQGTLEKSTGQISGQFPPCTTRGAGNFGIGFL